jgi:DNA invertase Pin-like site-specific DNA recombinase
MSSGYAVGLYLDRERNGEGYSPSNCRWVTAAKSVRNRDMTKLNEESVAAIRAAEGTHTAIAKQFGISRRHVGEIKDGKQWRESV